MSIVAYGVAGWHAVVLRLLIVVAAWPLRCLLVPSSGCIPLLLPGQGESSAAQALLFGPCASPIGPCGGPLSSVGWQTAPSTAGFFGRGACLVGVLSVRGCRLHLVCLVEGGAAPVAACASGQAAVVKPAHLKASPVALW